MSNFDSNLLGEELAEETKKKIQQKKQLITCELTIWLKHLCENIIMKQQHSTTYVLRRWTLLEIDISPLSGGGS